MMLHLHVYSLNLQNLPGHFYYSLGTKANWTLQAMYIELYHNMLQTSSKSVVAVS